VPRTDFTKGARENGRRRKTTGGRKQSKSGKRRHPAFRINKEEKGGKIRDGQTRVTPSFFCLYGDAGQRWRTEKTEKSEEYRANEGRVPLTNEMD